MIRSTVVVMWRNGLHLRPAAALVKMAANFHSTVVLRCGEKVADLRSILSVLTLCAGMGTGLVVEVAGDDEREAIQAIARFFDSGKTTLSDGDADADSPPTSRPLG